MSIADNITRIHDRMQLACDRAGRSMDDVQLIAVSKKNPPETINEAVDAGLRVFGESRVQELQGKISRCSNMIDWHLIGHLQSNKIKKAVPLFSTVHSIDSIKLLEGLNSACDEAGRDLKGYIEVNVAGEGSKYGIKPDDLPAFLEASLDCHRIYLQGLMTIPPWSPDSEKTRGYFVQLRELLADCEQRGFPMNGLSMGMSSDFETAIEEGATCIRVGTDIFGERKG